MNAVNGVSIVVPVYNVEKYLKRCLNSIISQTYSNIEIILVNDGSTDDSEKIAKDYLERDLRIKYFYKENGGLGAARNFGIRKAINKYICFIDSDDYIAKNYIEKLVEPLIQGYANVTWCDFFIVNNNKYKVEKHLPENIYKFHNASACNKMYLKDLFVINDIYFPENLWYEDLATIPRIMSVSHSNFYVEDALYYYCMNQGSITKSYNMRVMDMDYVLKILFDFALKNNNVVYDIDYLNVYHGVIDTTYRMLKCSEIDILTIKSHFANSKKNINNRLMLAKIYKRLPLKYKLFLIFVHKWNLPMLRAVLIK